MHSKLVIFTIIVHFILVFLLQQSSAVPETSLCLKSGRRVLCWRERDRRCCLIFTAEFTMRSSSARQTPGSLRAQQELAQRRRDLEEHRRESWCKTVSDHRRAVSQAEGHNKLNSQRMFQHSIDNYMKEQIREKKETDLLLRRTELSTLLHEEELHYQAELRDKLQDDKSDELRKMRERVEVLRQARMKHQEQIVAQKLEEVWKRDSQELRELKSKQVNLETAKAWGDQISIRQQTEEEEKMIEQQMVENMKREVQLAAEKDEQKQSEEKSRMKSLTEIWQEQIESLQKHEEQMKALQQQEREILKQLDSLAKMEDQRKKMEISESKKELGKTLMSQHAAHIRRRNRQVQESLEFDRSMLESITKMEEESLNKQQEDRQRRKTVAAQIRETMEERLRKEKEREKEVDRLDREEAKLYWEKREHEWRAEEDARKHLVEEVIGDLKEQLREKVAANRRAQQEVERGKEEVASMMRLSEVEKQKQLDAMTRAQSYRREELDTQVRELERREQHEREDEMADRSKKQMQQRNYDDFLSRETAKLGVGRSQSDVLHSRPSSTFSRQSMR